MCYTNEPVYTETFNGYEIEIWQDENPENPFEDWESEPPLAVLWPRNYGYKGLYGHRDLKEYATQYGNVSEAPTLTHKQIKANLSEIMDMLEVESVMSFRDSSYRPDIVSIINDRLSEYVSGLDGSGQLDALCSLYQMAGMIALCRSIHGYSQGDYADVLCVLTPDFLATTGAPKTKDAAKEAIDLFKYWAFGDVYSYLVKDENGEVIESCGGFFGDWDAPFGAIHEAQAAINWQITKDRKAHFEQVKTWIKNRVPLYARCAA